jgi:hypothetical protein
VAANVPANRFFAVWSDFHSASTYDAYSQLLDPAGALVSTNQLVGTGTVTGMGTPAVAPNPYCGNWVVAANPITPVTSVYTLTLVTLGACAPAYTLLSFTPGVANGVTSGGTAGAATTFQVTWWGANLPTTAMLLIDLDHNGTAGGTVTPRWPIDPAAGAPWAGAAALGLLLWAAWARRRALLAGALALGLVSGALAACSGSSGGGGGGGGSALPVGCTSECIAMTAADAADTNPVDGKAYTATVTIPAAGSYAYRFVFNDGTTAAIGVPAIGGTLTVN